MLHLLDALKRFESLDTRRVMEITFEVARLGESRLDYANPKKKYSLSRRILLRPPAHVPRVCRIQTHRSRARYRHGFERALESIFLKTPQGRGEDHGAF